MNARIVVFGSAFIVGLLASLGTGCGALCPCPDETPFPEAQGPLYGLEVASTDDHGMLGSTIVSPENGSIEVTGRSVVIRYTQGSVAHEVLYEITRLR